MLALALLGASGVFAQQTTVTVNLADIKAANSTTRWDATGTTTLIVERGSGNEDVFARWTDGSSAGAANRVDAVFRWHDAIPASGTVAAVAAGYGDTLYIRKSGSVDTVKIIGTLASTIKVSQIDFTGTDKVVNWDGGRVTGVSTAAARKNSEFLFLGATSDAGRRITILSGSIESWAISVLKDLKTPIGSALSAGTPPAPTGNMVGAIGSAAAGSRDITIKSHGKGAALVGDGNFAINPPGSGKYLIESDSVAVETAGQGTEVQIGSKLAGVGGVLTINAWTTATTSALAANGSTAVKASKITVVGVGNSGTSKNIVINSKSKAALAADGEIDVQDAQIDHSAATGTVGATVFSSATSSVNLKNVTVTNGSATGNLAGRIVEAGSTITIDGGKFANAGDSKGVALSTDKAVSIKGAKIVSAGTAATSGGYVVSGSTVNVASSASDSAVIAWAGTGAAVGGIYATDSVSVTTDNLYKAEVRVAGAGVGIDVYPSAVTPKGGTVVLSGSPGNSVFIRVATGQALVVKNDFAAANQWDVDINNTVISRSGTSSNTALIDVTGADVVVDGTSLTRTNISAGSNVAIVVKKNSNATGLLDGSLYIRGGSIAGVTGGVTAETVEIQRGVQGVESDRNVKIETQTGVAVKAVGGALNAAGTAYASGGNVTINNANAVILNTAGVASTNEVPSAAVFSLHKGITVWNVDSIRGGGSSVALLTLNPAKILSASDSVYNGTVYVFSGKIKAASAYAISAASNVYVNLVPKKSAAGAPDTLAARNVVGLGTAKGDSVQIGAKRGDIIVSTASTSPNFSAIYSDGGKVFVGKAEVSATAAGGATAVYTLRGEVTVDHEDALVSSASGTGIYVRNESVKVNGGNVISNPQSGNFAAIWVVDGDVTVGSARPTGWSNEEVKQWTRITSNGSLAIFADGAGKYKVNVGKYAVLNVKGAMASAGGVRALKNIDVVFSGKYTASGDKSKAFAIEAAQGDVNIVGAAPDSLATIKSDEGVAVSTVGGNINILGYTSVTGNAGKLLFAKDTVNRKAGTVTIGGVASVCSTGLDHHINIYNKTGTAIKAIEKVYVYGKTGDPTADTADAASRVVVASETDTAITTGKVTTAEIISGEVHVRGGRVWAVGNYNKSNPIAIASKKVYQTAGVIEANTEKTAVDNEEVYTDANATGISVRGDKSGAGEIKISGGKIIAHGKSTGIRNSDDKVLVTISPDSVPANSPRVWSIGNGRVSDKGVAAISIAAGNNGTAIWSKGEITVKGRDTIQESDRNAEGKLSVNVYLGSGNKSNARVINMPVDTGTNRKVLNLAEAFVEAGSDGAIAIEGGKNTLTNIDHSVVLVRHASTAVKGLGGVFVYSGYVEVLATEADNTGTAITGNEIRIDGGRAADGEKSEIHAKGIALEDLRKQVEGSSFIPVIEITSVVHLSGRVLTNVNVGSSVLGDTAYVTMGSENSARLYQLSTLNSNDFVREIQDTLVIPKGIKVFVADNGSTLETEENDVIIDSGTISTVGKQAGAKFFNSGKLVVKAGGTVNFNKIDNQSFYNNSTGTVVLSLGSKLDDTLLYHDSGTAYLGKNYTFLRWARALGDGERGDGTVIIPPLFASLWNNNGSQFTENTDWDVFSSRTDSVYTVVENLVFPVDNRYKPYIYPVTEGALNSEGDLPFSGAGVEWVDEEGQSAYLTVASHPVGSSFTRTAKLANEAGVGTKDYKHTVLKVPLAKIDAWQDEASSEYFFEPYALSAEGDTSFIRLDAYEPLYTGKDDDKAIKVRGALSAVTVYPDDKEVYYGGTNGFGLGEATIWYESAEGSVSFYQLSSRVPVNVGKYNVFASFTEGRDFLAVPSKDAVYVGTFEIKEGTVESVFGKKTTDSQRLVSLKAGEARTVRVPLPKVHLYEAKYMTDFEPDGDIEGYVPGSAKIVGENGDTLVFDVNALSEIGQSLTFALEIDPSYAKNFQSGQFITVRANFLSAENMVEATPTYVRVNYKNEKLTGFNTGGVYVVDGKEVAFGEETSEIAIEKEWVESGKTVTIVAKPGPDSYKTESKPASIVINARPGVSAALDSVKAEPVVDTTRWGRLVGTTAAMEYKKSTDSVWTQAGNVATTGLKAGTYDIRFAATETAFASASVQRTVANLVSVAENDRVIPGKPGVTEVAVAPVKVVAHSFTAGPSPVSKNGEVKFFSTKSVKNGSLYVFDATGKSIAKVAVKSGKGTEIGSLNLKGKAAEGTYVVKGVLIGKDGTKDKVSFVFSVGQ